jgi:uncharacterized protein (TIGR02117 family)
LRAKFEDKNALKARFHNSSPSATVPGLAAPVIRLRKSKPPATTAVDSEKRAIEGGERKVPVNRWIAFIVGCLPVAAAILLTVACQPSPAVVSASAERPAPVAGGGAVYVTSNGWHTGIVVARTSLHPGSIPEAADFPDAPYLEFGWGDADYYPAPRPTLGMALGATLGANPAIVHMAGLPAHPGQVHRKAEVVELALSPDGIHRLVSYLDATFARAGARRIPASAPGLYSFSRFYPAIGEFNLLNTCNTWTARGLAAAGLPVEASGVVSAEDLMTQLRKIAAD